MYIYNQRVQYQRNIKGNHIIKKNYDYVNIFFMIVHCEGEVVRFVPIL